MTTVHEIIDEILDAEGGYSDHPDDAGGPTKFGITLQPLVEYWRRPVTVKELKHLTRGQAANIIRQRYYLDPAIDRLPIEIQPAVLDFAVHSGPARAIKVLQRVVHAVPDGVIGPETISAVADFVRAEGERGAITQLTEERLVFLSGIVVKRPENAVFMKGWVRRVCRFL